MCTAFAKDKPLRVGIYIKVGGKEENDVAFSKLKANQSKIEKEIGRKLVWDSRPALKTCFVYLPIDGTIDDDEQRLNEIIEWVAPTIVKFREVFAPLVKEL